MDQLGELDLDMVIGDDWTAAVELVDVAVLSDGPFDFVIEDANRNNLVEARIGSGVTLTSLAPNASATIDVARAITATVPEGRWRYSVRVVDAAGKRQTYLCGYVNARLEPEVSA